MGLKKINKVHLNKTIRFIILLLVLGAYTFFTIYKYGLKDGPLVSLTTWSFFVFCTPIADAGFLIDFPVRMLTGLKMIYTEVIVWIVAGLITFYALNFAPEIFQTSVILELFHLIITNLFPYGAIIILSGIGTFFSVYFGEEILETSISGLKRHKYNKHKSAQKLILFGFLIAFILIVYYYLLENLDIHISLF